MGRKIEILRGGAEVIYKRTWCQDASCDVIKHPGCWATVVWRNPDLRANWDRLGRGLVPHPGLAPESIPIEKEREEIRKKSRAKYEEERAKKRAKNGN